MFITRVSSNSARVAALRFDSSPARVAALRFVSSPASSASFTTLSKHFRQMIKIMKQI